MKVQAFNVTSLLDIRVPTTTRSISEETRKEILDNVQPGDVILETNNAYPNWQRLERLAFRSSFTHAAIFEGWKDGKPMLLEGGLKWQSLSMTPAEMDFVALKASAAREIALAFGVPPMMLGLPGDNTYANYREANKALWRQTILPLMAKILGGIAQGLRPAFPGLELSVDLDKVPELADERTALWERVSGAGFLSDEEKRAMLGLGV